MAKVVFIHNPRSKYDDIPAVHYHFPKQYLKRAEQAIGDWILYYESGKNGGQKSYTAIAQVKNICPDPVRDGFYYAQVKPRTYLDFDKTVPFRLDGIIANSNLMKPDGSVNSGYAVSAVQPIPDPDFYRIVDAGFIDEQDVLPRDSTMDTQYAFTETQQAEFLHARTQDRIEIKLNKIKRDQVFRKIILAAYKKKCAFTGLGFINGRGRAEVQAAHIKPVAANGPDCVQNGLALSGTVHWMFDRGLLSISNDYDILVSRHINNLDEIDRLLHADRKVVLPSNRHEWPHPVFMEWHRNNCFKT